MKPIQVDIQEIINRLVDKIANLELQLASEQSAKQAVIKYAESLEVVLEKNGIDIDVEETDAK